MNKIRKGDKGVVMNKCGNCIHWQTNKKLKQLYCDCYMVIGYLVPNFLDCYSDLGYKFTLPFDPHDVKYFTNSITFKKLYNKLYSLTINDAVRKDNVLVEDLIFDSLGRLLIKKVNLLYFKTRKGYCCDYYKKGGKECIK